MLEQIPAIIVMCKAPVARDLKRLREDILKDENAANIASNTAKWLRQNENLF